MRQQLLEMKSQQTLGRLNRLDVHMVYSHDRELVTEAKVNQLTIGRQMLLNQSRRMGQGWDESTIITASLSSLVHTLLGHDVTDLTELFDPVTQSLSAKEDSETTTSQLPTQATIEETRIPVSEGFSEQSNPSSWESSASQTTSQTSQHSESETTPESSPSASSEPIQSSSIEPSTSTIRDTIKESTSTATAEPSSSSTGSPGPGSPEPSASSTMNRKMGRYSHFKI